MTRHLVLVNGLPGSGKTTLAGRLGPALGAVVISKDAIKEAVADAVALDDGAHATLGGAAMEMAWTLAAGVDGTAVVESWWFAPRDEGFVRSALARLQPARVTEVWCDAGPQVARRRYASRHRHAIHRDADRLRDSWDTWETRARPLALSPVVTVDTSGALDLDALVDQLGGRAETS